MLRIFSLLLCIVLLAGCGSDPNQPKYEAAKDDDQTQTADSSDAPDWARGSSPESGILSTDATQTGGLNSGGGGLDPTKGNPSGQPTPGESGKGSANKTRIAANKNPQNAKTDKGSPESKGDVLSNPPTVTLGSGSETELMAQLDQKIRESQTMLKESEQKSYASEEELNAVRDRYAQLLEKRLIVCNKLLELELRDKDREKATIFKLDAHQQLADLNREGHEEKLYAFGETLKDDSNNNLRKRYEFLKFIKPFKALIKGNEIDKEAFYAQFEKIVSYWRDDVEVFRTADIWLTELSRAEKKEVFLKLLEISVDNFFLSTNKQIMDGVAIMKDRLLIAKVGFDDAILAVAAGEEGSAKRLMDAAARVLAQKELSAFVLMQVAQAGLQLEVKHNYEMARAYFKQLEERVKEVGNESNRKKMQVLVDNANIRLNMLGKPVTIEGMVPKIVDGKFMRDPIDYSAYKGKVVLVFFWAVQNKISVQLYHQLDKLYLANQDKDFAMIGINIDQDPRLIAEVMRQETPKRKWTHLMPMNPTMIGMNSVMARRCGVDSMPYNFLIDKEGNVAELRVFFGNGLEDRLEELLGEKINRISKPEPPEKKADEPKSTDEKSTDAKSSDAKPTEKAKQSDPKPSDPKPSDAKPSDPKPTEAKPTEKAKQSDPKKSEAKSSDKKSSEKE